VPTTLVPITDLDRNLLQLLRTRGHDPRAEWALGAYSKLGEHGAVWIALGTSGGLLDRDRGRRRRWRRGVMVVGAAYVLNQAVKFTVRRRRPELPGLPPLAPTISRLSFPSAHATTAFAAARAFSGLAPAWALYGAAGLLALSRPYLGVHYPSDVLAGATLGTVLDRAWPGGAPCR
jgi:membrane-associated phospholipid phosphatase